MVLVLTYFICIHVSWFPILMQGPLAQIEMVPVILSVLGATPGVLCLIPLQGETFWEHLLKHMAFKVSNKISSKTK